MITEIACNAPGCARIFQAADRPAFIAAQEFGWVVGDPTLCPTHASEGADRVLAAVDEVYTVDKRCAGCIAVAEQYATYGRHRRWISRAADAEFWVRIVGWAVHDYQRPSGTRPVSHRLTDTRRMTVAELRGALA